MEIVFTGKIWFWRGPAPWYFVTIPEDQSLDLKAIAPIVTYGWGVLPVKVQINTTTWETSLFPKDGRYLVPLRASVRKAENLNLNDEVTIRLKIHL